MSWAAAPALTMIAMLILAVGRLELRFRRGLVAVAAAEPQQDAAAATALSVRR